MTHGAGELHSVKNVKNNILDMNSQWYSWVCSEDGMTSHRANKDKCHNPAGHVVLAD